MEPLPRRQPGADLPTQSFRAVAPAAADNPLFTSPAEQRADQHDPMAVVVAAAAPAPAPRTPVSAWFEPRVAAVEPPSGIVPSAAALFAASKVLFELDMPDASAWVYDWATARDYADYSRTLVGG